MLSLCQTTRLRYHVSHFSRTCSISIGLFLSRKSPIDIDVLFNVALTRTSRYTFRYRIPKAYFCRKIVYARKRALLFRAMTLVHTHTCLYVSLSLSLSSERVVRTRRESQFSIVREFRRASDESRLRSAKRRMITSCTRADIELTLYYLSR